MADPFELTPEEYRAKYGNCEGCGRIVCRETNALWYGQFLLCEDCKAKSVTTRWLPARAAGSDRSALEADRQRLGVSEHRHG